MKTQRLIIRTVILLLLLAAVGYTLYANFFTNKEAVAIGDKAPDFVVTDLDGKNHRLSEYKGKGIFLNFWGTWCPPCKKEMPYIQAQYENYKNKGVEVLAIDVGEPEFSVRKFVEEYELTFPIAIDQKDQLLNAYGIDPLPVTFLIDKNGEIIDIITGEMTEQMIISYMEQIKP